MKLLILSLAIFGVIPAFSENKPYQELSGLNGIFHKAQTRKPAWFVAVTEEQLSGRLLAGKVFYKPPKKEDASAPLPACDVIAHYERAKFRGNVVGIAGGVAAYLGTRAILRRLIGMEGGGIIGESVRLGNISVALAAGVAAGLVVRHYAKKHYLDKYLSS